MISVHCVQIGNLVVMHFHSSNRIHILGALAWWVFRIIFVVSGHYMWVRCAHTMTEVIFEFQKREKLVLIHTLLVFVKW